MKITISFDLETFEFSVSAKFVLMTKCLQDFSQFLLTPRQGQLWQLSVLQLHIKNWPHIHYWVTKTKQLKIQIFPHQNYEPLKDNCNLHSLKDL